jgi:hypothetical protein
MSLFIKSSTLFIGHNSHYPPHFYIEAGLPKVMMKIHLLLVSSDPSKGKMFLYGDPINYR